MPALESIELFRKAANASASARSTTCTLNASKRPAVIRRERLEQSLQGEKRNNDQKAQPYSRKLLDLRQRQPYVHDQGRSVG
jgi:hypothetical protein